MLDRNRNPDAPETAAAETASGRNVLRVSRPSSPRRRTLGLSAASIEASSPFCVPAPSDTLELINRYFKVTGELFPFINQAEFLATYHTAAASNFRSANRTWLGLLYMVLAMATSATSDSQLNATQRGADSNVFYQRARAVCETNVRVALSLENGISTIVCHEVRMYHADV